MKRSKSIRLILIGSLTAGTLAGCGKKTIGPPVTTENVYTNNYQLPGVGYYHAPFRAWYTHPYNYFDAGKKLYFFGGQWGIAPHQTITNISSPTAESAKTAQANRTDHVPVHRSGFGSSSRHHSVWS